MLRGSAEYFAGSLTESDDVLGVKIVREREKDVSDEKIENGEVFD